MQDERDTSHTSYCSDDRSIKGILSITWSVFWTADTTTIRMLLGMASFFWAAILVINPAILSEHPYQIMYSLAPSKCWAFLFFLYFLGVVWRIYDPCERIRWALGVNAFGLSLWVVLTLCMNIQAGSFLPGSSLEAVVCFFAAWALVRTGLGKDVVTP